MESEPEEDNCPRITDNSFDVNVYIVNEGDCIDKWVTPGQAERHLRALIILNLGV